MKSPLQVVRDKSNIFQDYEPGCEAVRALADVDKIKGPSED